MKTRGILSVLVVAVGLMLGVVAQAGTLGLSQVEVTSAEVVRAGLGGGCGPCNMDCFIGLNDLDIVLSNWNLNVPPGDPCADSSGD